MSDRPLTPAMEDALRRLAKVPLEDPGRRRNEGTLNALVARGLVHVSGSGYYELTDRGAVVVEDELPAVAS